MAITKQKHIRGILLSPDDVAFDGNVGELKVALTAKVLQVYLDGASRDVITHDQVQTLSNKTLTAPVINSPTGLVKADVGLSNVDDTSDATKNAAAVALTNHTIDADLNTITNIENADIKVGAAIDASKIADGSVSSTEFQYINSLTSNAQTQLNGKASSSLTDSHILVGNASNIATDVAVTGDVTISNAGVTAIATGVIVNADINASAAIDASKIADGTVSSTEFQYINSLSSNAQTQIDTKVAGPASATDTAIVKFDGTTGKLVKNSGITIDSSNNIAGIGTITQTQVATPANPSASTNKLYFKTDNNLYSLTSAGVETQISTVGSSKPLEIFNNTVQLNGSSSTALGVLHFKTPQALTITSVILQLFEKNGISSGNIEMDLKVNTTPNDTGMSTIFTTKPILNLASVSDYDTNSGTLSTTSVASGSFIRLDFTQVPAGFVGYVQVLVYA